MGALNQETFRFTPSKTRRESGPQKVVQEQPLFEEKYCAGKIDLKF